MGLSRRNAWPAMLLIVALMAGLVLGSGALPSAVQANAGAVLSLAGGATWATTTVAVDVGEEFLTSSIALDGASAPHIAYTHHAAEPGDGQEFSVHHTVRPEGTWLSELVAEDAIWPSLALDASGAPHIAYHRRADMTIMYTVREGDAWPSEEVASPASVPSLALDASGVPHMTYTIQGPAVHYVLWDGVAWQEELAHSPAGGPWLVLDGEGTPHIAYCGFGPIDGVWYASWSDEFGWDHQQVHDSACDGIRMALDEQGTPHIAYAPFDPEFPEFPGVWYAVWDGVAWQREHISADAGSFALAVDQAGAPHLLYVEADGPETAGLRYARRADESWVVETVHHARAGGVSLALDADDNPHISYYDLDQATLMYATRLVPRAYLPLVTFDYTH